MTKYMVLCDDVSDWGYLTDWEKYKTIPWWRLFARNKCIVAAGRIKKMTSLGVKMNADPENALTILAEWGKQKEKN